ncbi:MAG TPA: choice-of-anchor V domain-containing protein [Blastocatellia bacterium]|nr:choice-of-anchor V domain-containing protein [Blastocatellia bacterium]
MLNHRPTNKRIKLATLAFASMVALFIIAGDKANAFSSGPLAAHTGAPGEFLCTSCHTSFEPDTGPGFVQITGLPASYLPGQQVTATITVNHPDGFLYGFQLTAIDSTGAQAGTLVVTDEENTQLLADIVGGNFRQYLEQTFAGAFPVEFNQRSWSFKWDPPQSNIGPVTFYAAGNGANGDSESTGDHIYTTSVAITEPPPTLVPSSQSFAANGGNGSINIVVPSGFGWTASTSDSFITITSPASGTGNGMVTYTVEANANASTRTGTITVAGLTFTVLQGLAFDDVPTDHPFYTEIGKLSARGVTLGCDGDSYCPDTTVTRDQMAAFIIRALGNFNPPQPAMQRFADVPPTNFFYAFIEEMAVRQITLGCGGGNYCPTDPVLRDQMAAFIIRALHEPGYTPPTPAMQRFADVPPTNFFYAFIEEMAVRQITLGCGGGNYCPSLPVSRGQMAAFLVRAFNL